MQSGVGHQLSYVVHDLKNPLTAIRIQAELALRQLNGDGQATASRQLKGILRAVDWMNDLVADLLDSQQAGPEGVVSVPEYVLAAVEQLRFLAEERGVTFNISLSEDLPLIHARRCQALPIILNVLANAIQHGPTGGAIHVSAHTADNHVVISVRDEGMGISGQIADRVFEPGVRGKQSRGHGLGLAIAATRVSELGGQIWVEPAEPHGAVFHFSLPCRLPSTNRR